MKRRDFLKIVALGGVVVAAGALVNGQALGQVFSMTKESKEAAPVRVQKKRFGMVIDAGACIGCRQCQYACKMENNVPDSISPPWVEVFEMDLNEPASEISSVPPSESRTKYTDSPKPGKWYLSAMCYHCEDPPCVKVCPVGATTLGEDGIVEMDYKKCIGCRNCMAACPYNARRFNWGEPVLSNPVNPLVPVREKGVVEKCTFCVHRTRNGQLPRCVEVCPVGARRFGDLNDPNSPPSLILASQPSFRLIEEMSTRPKVYYVFSGKKWTTSG
jgi:Fe-S-cluster-containing dehydrogenase component